MKVSLTVRALFPLHELNTHKSIHDILAYDDTMKVLTIAATVLSVVPILFSLMMPNYYLGDKQNAVDQTDLTGAHSEEREE